MTEDRYPECEKVYDNREDSQTIGAFLEWLQETHPTWVTLRTSINNLLMEYYDVDPVAHEKEQREMLDTMRRLNEKKD